MNLRAHDQITDGITLSAKWDNPPSISTSHVSQVSTSVEPFDLCFALPLLEVLGMGSLDITAKNGRN